jgi:hypothetical protein
MHTDAYVLSPTVAGSGDSRRGDTVPRGVSRAPFETVRVPDQGEAMGATLSAQRERLDARSLAVALGRGLLLWSKVRGDEFARIADNACAGALRIAGPDDADAGLGWVGHGRVRYNSKAEDAGCTRCLRRG